MQMLIQVREMNFRVNPSLDQTLDYGLYIISSCRRSQWIISYILT